MFIFVAAVVKMPTLPPNRKIRKIAKKYFYALFTFSKTICSLEIV